MMVTANLYQKRLYNYAGLNRKYGTNMITQTVYCKLSANLDTVECDIAYIIKVS